MKKARLYFLIVCILFLAVIFLFLYVSRNCGVHELTFHQKDNKIYLKVKYVDCMGYSIETVKNNETILKGERAIALSELIGKNTIKITLYETEISDNALKYYEYFKVYETHLKSSDKKKTIDIKFILYPSPEHSLKIYVGFDDVLEKSTNERMRINGPLGVINLELGEVKSTQEDS